MQRVTVSSTKTRDWREPIFTEHLPLYLRSSLLDPWPRRQKSQTSLHIIFGISLHTNRSSNPVARDREGSTYLLRPVDGAPVKCQPPWCCPPNTACARRPPVRVPASGAVCNHRRVASRSSSRPVKRTSQPQTKIKEMGNQN